MGFDTIIKNATIVTAVDTTRADVGISGAKISAIAAQLSEENATQTIEPAIICFFPAASMSIRISTCLSAEPCLPTISRPAPLPWPLAAQRR
jgi:urease alpha subunit